MLRNTLIALTASASLVVGAAALTPAMANYPACSENPSANSCPGNYDVTKESFYVAPHGYTAASHKPSRAARR